LSEVPEIHGRSAAGVSHISTGQARPNTARVAPPQSICRTQARFPRRPSERSYRVQAQASVKAGTSISATPIFVSKPRPMNTPVHTIHVVRCVSSARRKHQVAATDSSTNSSSGLLWRLMATIVGVVQSTRPAANPATRPKRRRTRSYVSPAAMIPITAWGASSA
jgi:hypothetical protein